MAFRRRGRWNAWALGGAPSYTGVLREIGAVTIGPLSDLRRWLRDEGQRILAGHRPA